MEFKQNWAQVFGHIYCLSIFDLSVLLRYKTLAQTLPTSFVGDNMKKLKFLILFILGTTLLMACNQKKSGVKASTASIAGVAIGTNCLGTNTNANSTFIGTAATGVGSIYDSQNAFNFEAQVKSFLSATLSPYEVGTISAQPNDTTGVRFGGLIKLDGSGAVIGTQSRLTITVYDSVWFMSQTAANLIEVAFNPSGTTTKGAAITGQFDLASGDGFLSLRDQYGEVRFEGRIDAQNFSGVVRFQNLTAVNGGSPASGTLGQFFIQRCVIFQ